jgi:hypothetical protein
MARGSEASLVDFALAPLDGRDDVTVLCAVDDALPSVLARATVQRVDVLGPAPDDARVRAHAVELGLLLKQLRLGAAAGPEGGWLAIIVDAPAESDDAWIERLEAALRPGGVLAVRAPHRDVELFKRLHARLQHAAEAALPADGEGEAALDYVYRARRPAPPADPRKAN